MLALDGSGSMTRSAEAARSAALAFVHSLRKEDPLGVMVFADKVALSHDLSTKRELSEEAVQAYETNGGTALYDALGEAVARLKTVNGRRVVVLVTDGRDENAASNGPGSSRTWEQALAEVSAVEATVYAIGIGTARRSRAARTGCRADRWRGLLHQRRQRARSQLPPHRRRTAAALSDRLHLDEQQARRRLAQGGDPQQGRHRAIARRLLRAGTMKASVHHPATTLLFAVTLFTSASLVFVVEPMFGKMVLPPPGRHSRRLEHLHGVLPGRAARWLRVRAPADGTRFRLAHAGRPPRGRCFSPPSWRCRCRCRPTGLHRWIARRFLHCCTALLSGVGVPLLVLSATAPLLQKWFSATRGEGGTGSLFPLRGQQRRQHPGAPGLSARHRTVVIARHAERSMERRIHSARCVSLPRAARLDWLPDAPLPRPR